MNKEKWKCPNCGSYAFSIVLGSTLCDNCGCDIDQELHKKLKKGENNSKNNFKWNS